jgi:spore coat protein CotF
MMNQQNKIQNPQSNIPQGKSPQMNDRDMVNDTLSSLKYLTDNYNVFTREASHLALHQDVLNMLAETHSQTRAMYNLMFRKGWYSLEMEQPQKLQQTHQQFAGYQTQFPYQNMMMQ